MDSAIPLDLILQILQQSVGARVEIHGCQVAQQYPDYLVLLLQLHHPSIEVVAKFAGPKAPLASSFDRTAMLHRLVATRTTIAIPEIIALNMSYQAWPWRYLIKTYIPGLEWAKVKPQMSPAELSAAYRQLGDAVAQLHTIEFSTFGEIDVDGGIRQPQSYLAALTEHTSTILPNAHLRDLFLSVLEQYQALFQEIRSPGLCHEDLHKYNLLFQHHRGKWRLATILDFDKAWAGFCETDLARFELWEGETGEAFWQAYTAIHPIEPLYAQRRAIYQLLWCLEYAEPTEKHLADTRRLCVELGIRGFEGFC